MSFSDPGHKENLTFCGGNSPLGCSYSSMKKFQILAIDGGGMRGLFPAGILARLEETYCISVADHFDLVVGTSTGGIIALGLGKGLAPDDIEEFYLERGPRIFAGAENVLRSIAHLAEAKYDSSPLQRELQECFGQTLLGESTKRLVVTSYDMENDDLRLIKTAHHPRLRNDYTLPMWQAALATSAAPTYFTACKAIKYPMHRHQLGAQTAPG